MPQRMAKKRPLSFKPAGLPPAVSPAPATSWVFRSDAVAEPVGDMVPAPAAAATPASVAPAAAIAVVNPPSPPVTNQRTPQAIVGTYVALAAAAGLVPIPFVDAALISSIQLKMIDALAVRYGVPFDRELGKAMLAATAGSVISTRFGKGLGRSLLKATPGVGWIIGEVAVPVYSGASTYAIGLLFIRHFEKGGTLANFTPAVVPAA